MYPERLRLKLTEDMNLGDLIIELKGSKEISISEVASKTGLTYFQIFNKIKPLLEREGYRFIRSSRS
jgi:hypothetical protein